MPKRCYKCGEDKPLKEFPFSYTHDGRGHICRKCNNARHNKREAANGAKKNDKIYEELMRIV